MIDEPGRVGVVLLGFPLQVVLVLPVEHMGGLPRSDVEEAVTERDVVIGGMGVDESSKGATFARVYPAGAFVAVSGMDASSIGRGRRPR